MAKGKVSATEANDVADTVAATFPADASSALPTFFDGKYSLERLIGRGGMGEVWRARHTTLGSPVAIKLLRAGLAEDAPSRERFLTEARLAANLRSPNAVSVFDFGVTNEGHPYIVMELLEGETLAQRITRCGPLSTTETVRILRQAARALDRAHALGVVHRDFKPANIQLVADGDRISGVKVLDFGVAKLVGEIEAWIDAHPARSGDESRNAGMIGTPSYMPPEQIHKLDIGPAADVWALGVVAYECMTGRRPFRATSEEELLSCIVAALYEPPSKRNDQLPTEVDAWFACACALSPMERFAGAGTAVEALAIAVGDTAPASDSIAPVPFGSGDAMDLFDPSVSTTIRSKVSVADMIAIGLVIIALLGGLAALLWAE